MVILFSCPEFVSKEMVLRNLHLPKHLDPRISTRRGIVIDLKEEHQKAFDSIQTN
jgi:hypothetical protein